MKILINSNSKILTDKYISELAHKENISSNNIFIHTFSIDNIKKAQLDFTTNTFFEDRKLVLIRDCDIKKTKAKDNKFNENSVDFIAKNFNINEENILILEASKDFTIEFRKIQEIDIVKISIKNNEFFDFSNNYLRRRGINYNFDLDERKLMTNSSWTFNNLIWYLKHVELVRTTNNKETLKSVSNLIGGKYKNNNFQILNSILSRNSNVLKENLIQIKNYYSLNNFLLSQLNLFLKIKFKLENSRDNNIINLIKNEYKINDWRMKNILSVIKNIRVFELINLIKNINIFNDVLFTKKIINADNVYLSILINY